MSQPHADRNLLFGVLALQLDFIGRDQLVAALHAWVLDKHKLLGQILVEQRALKADAYMALEVLVDKHLEVHDHKPQRSLAALSVAPALHQDLRSLGDPDLLDSLAGLAATPPYDTVMPPAEFLTVRPDAQANPVVVGEGTSLGLRFEVLRPHAEGGLGRVSLARDRELNRDVALKEIKPEYCHNAGARTRFLAEAEITGALEHPGIVPVYGLGRFADGRPFYAMRFVQGQSLLEAIRDFHAANWRKRPSEKALALRGLLRRFADLCNAVAYAHSRGLLHRDIKPANVLLGPYGETLLVDWGLAKVLPLEEGKTVPPEGFLRPTSDGVATQAGAVLGTPSYMAPEQAGGGSLGPAADVYGLGATLYHLLAGRAPFEGSSAQDIVVQVVQGLCKPPRQVKPDVPPPLSAVCQKAMALQPQARYRSAKELAAEVERWLADEPVAAHREPLARRLGRWGRRHRVLVSGLGMLLATSLLGLGVGLWAVRAEQRKTSQERDQAQANLGLAEANLALAHQAVDECFLLAKEHPLLQREEMRAVKKLLLEKALPFYRNFQVRQPDATQVQEERAGIAFRVGIITWEIGRKTEARTAFQEALDLYTTLVDRHPEVAAYQQGLARTFKSLGILHHEAGEVDAARRSYQESWRLCTALVEKNPEMRDYQADLAKAYNNLSIIQREAGEPKEALRSLQEVQRIFSALVQRYPEVQDYQAQLADTYQNLSVVQEDLGQQAASVDCLQETLRLYTDLAKHHPEVSDYQAGLADAHDMLGIRQRDAGNREGSLHHHQEALRLRTVLVQRHPDFTEYSYRLAGTYNGVGLAKYDAGDLAAARHSWQESLRLYTNLAQKDPDNIELAMYLAGIRVNLGLVLEQEGKPQDSLALYQQAIAVLQDAHRRLPGHPTAGPFLCNALKNHAHALRTLGRHGEAVADLEKALGFAEESKRPLIRTLLAGALARAGEYVRAVSMAAEFDRLPAVGREECYNLACAWSLCAAAARRDGKLSLAEQYTRRAVEYFKKVSGPFFPVF
jgi:serine/threonine-protein kinase